MATPDSSFGFVKREGNTTYLDYATSPETYAYAGYADLYESGGYTYAGVSEFLPFEENYLYRNFIFSSTNLDAFGEIKTGVYWNPDVYLEAPEQSLFHPPASSSSIPSVLTATQAQWTIWRDDFPFLSAITTKNVGVSVNANSVYTMSSGARNLFGLPYLSFKVANSSGVAALNLVTSVDDNAASN